MKHRPLDAETARSLDLCRGYLDDMIEGGEPVFADPASPPGEKLAALQIILDGAGFGPDDLDPLSAVGVGFGDAIATSLAMTWVWFEDERYGGGEPSLKLDGYDAFVSPLSMIARRVEEGRAVDVRRLASDTIEQIRRIRSDVACRPTPTVH